MIFDLMPSHSELFHLSSNRSLTPLDITSQALIPHIEK